MIIIHRISGSVRKLSRQKIGLALLTFAPLLILGFSSTAFAQDFVPLARIPHLTDMAPNEGGLAVFFNNLYKYLIGLAATLAVLQIIYSGIQIAINQDNISKITDDKGKIYNAIAGLALVLAPALVFSIINPNILNLSVNLPPLDLSTRSANVTPGGLNQTNAITGQRSNQASSGINGNGVNNTYTDPSTIPAGQWCYSQQTTNGTAYACLPDQGRCDSMFRYAGSAATGTCRQYPVTN